MKFRKLATGLAALVMVGCSPTVDGHAQGAVGEACFWKDAHFTNNFLCMGAFSLGRTYYRPNFAIFDFNDITSSLVVGGLRRDVTCRLVIFRDINENGPRMVLHYNFGGTTTHDVTGNTLYHARLRRNLKFSVLSNGQNANDKASSASLRCAAIL